MALELSSRSGDFREGLRAFTERREPDVRGPLRPAGPEWREGTAMEFDTILYEVEDRTATITFNRPEQLNALSPHMAGELRRAYAAAEADEKVWTLLVTGNGRAFCAGADVTEIPDDGRVIYEEPYLSTYPQWEAPQEATPPFRTMTKPILTAVNGLCCGAGLDLVTTGDIAIASDRAEFFDPHVSIGLVSGREMVRLARALPTGIAMRMALTGRHERMSAQRAYELGLISEVVEHDRLARAGQGDGRPRQPQRAVGRARHPAGHPQGPRPAAARGRDPGRDLPGAGRAHRRRQGRPARLRGEAPAEVERHVSAADPAAFETIRYETSDDHVATITLDRPEVLNAFDRQMCQEMRDAWRLVKDDPEVHAVVLRAAGDRAFCAGLDTKKPYGQPDDVWNHEDPGELLSPKWQKVWKPVVCAVQGMCTAGAFYFLNEADIVICSTDATFFDSHVTYGLVSALEPVGLMRRVGLAETLRMALTGNDERVTAETALRIGLVTEVVDARRARGCGPTSWPPASPRSPWRRPRARCGPSGSRSTGPTGPPWSRA